MKNQVRIVQRQAESSGINFELGHLDEICGILTSKSDANLHPYPALFMLEDVTEEVQPFGRTATVQLLLVVQATPEDEPLTRWEKNVEENLHPLLEIFINNLEVMCDISNRVEITRTRVSDAFGVSQNGKQVFNDFLDGIELKGLKITYIPDGCE